MADVPVAITGLPAITDLAPDDVMVAVDISAAVASQTGKVEVSQLKPLTNIVGLMTGNTTGLTTAEAILTSWTTEASNFMTTAKAAGSFTAEYDGWYRLTITIITNYGTDNAALLLYGHINAGGASLLGSSLTRTGGTGTATATALLQLTAADVVTIGAKVTTGTGALTNAHASLERIL